MLIPELDEGIKSQTTSLQKKLLLTNGDCLHTNHVKISRVEPQQAFQQPLISMKTKQEENNIVKHFLEIKLNNRTFIVEDIYSFAFHDVGDNNVVRQIRSFISSNESRNSSGSEQAKGQRKKSKKVCLFQKKKTKLGIRYRKRNTKNIPKNFVKAFSNFMDCHGRKDNSDWRKAMQELRKFEARDNFNNITVKKIMQNALLIPFFKEFLENHAENWINNSKIADKRVHLEAIQLYLELLGKLSYADEGEANSPSDS